MPSEAEPSPSLFDRLVAREEKQGLLLVAFLRICMLAFILLLFSKPNLPTGQFYSLLEVIGWFIPGVFIQLFVAMHGRKWQWMLYLIALVDAGLIVYVSVVPDPLHPFTEHPAWLYSFVVRDRSIVFSMIMLALVIMNFSPRLILWFGFWLFASWCAGIYWLSTRPGILISEQFGDDWVTSHDDITSIFSHPEFLDLSSLIEQVIILVVFSLACAVMVSRLRVLINQFAAAERAHGNLARYFPAVLADRLADRDEPIRIGQRRNCVILFADIVGFSEFAEKRDPQDVMRLLNQFHSIMTSQIGAYGGIVEKYIGDAVMASFDAFDAIDFPAANALCAANAMTMHIHEWQKNALQDNHQPLGIGIGLNFGPAVVGDIGQKEAMTPAVIGASVNLTARLEHATRTLDADIVLSKNFAQKIYQEIPDSSAILMATFTKEAQIQVKGFSQAVPIVYAPRQSWS